MGKDIPAIFLGKLCKFYNLFIKRKKKNFLKSGLQELNEIKKRSARRTEMCDHLITLFNETLQKNPKLIVELGVNTGESTFVFRKIAELTSAKLISVDIKDFSKKIDWGDSIFVQKDDIIFAKEFKDFCKKKDISSKIDILFIDTSHRYKHTVQEVESWFPLLSDNAKVFLHDTNLHRIFFRRDGSIGLGIRNMKRDVIRAIEKYFKKKFNEYSNFTDFVDGWLIKHYTHCNGFMILEKIPHINKSNN